MENRTKDLNPNNGKPIDPWSMCTVRQVEELKAVIKVIPIWSSGFIVFASISQYTFLVVQAATMDRHIFPNFEIPTTNLAVFAVFSMTIWVALYDRILVPLISKHTTKKGFSIKQRIGIGIFLSVLSEAVAAFTETKRRRLAISEGLMNKPKGIVNMSVWWLVPQLCLKGVAEGFNFIGNIEFFYSQFPKSMSSIAIAFFSLCAGMGNLIASVIVKIVNDVTERGGRESWLSPNVNKGHYDYYYGMLTILGMVNMLYFLVCSWGYGSNQAITWDDQEVDIELESKSEISHSH